MEAVCGQHSKVVDILLEAKVNVNLGGDDDYTPLMEAAGDDQLLLKVLLDAAADVNLADKTGKTALLAAANNNNSEAVKLLVEARADIHFSLAAAASIKKVTMDSICAMLL